MVEKKLPASFYPYFIINTGWWIWNVLVKSSFYKTHKQLYNEKIIESQEVDEPQNLKAVIDEIFQIVRTVNPNFIRNSIKFKKFGAEFQDEVVCFNNNILYFSEKLKDANLSRIKKFWMLETVCHFFHIDSMKLLINSCPFFNH